MKEAASAQPIVDTRARFESMVRGGVFKPTERFVCRDVDAEERIAEGIGLTWKWYSREAAKGHIPELALVRHAARCRMVDRSRRVDSGDRRRWTEDVHCQQGRTVEIKRLQLLDHEDDRIEDDPRLGLAELGCTDPGDNYNSALDLKVWLGTLSARDRTMLAMRNAGHGLVAIGNKLKCTSSDVGGVDGERVDAVAEVVHHQVFRRAAALRCSPDGSLACGVVPIDVLIVHRKGVVNRVARKPEWVSAADGDAAHAADGTPPVASVAGREAPQGASALSGSGRTRQCRNAAEGNDNQATGGLVQKVLP